MKRPQLAYIFVFLFPIAVLAHPAGTNKDRAAHLVRRASALLETSNAESIEQGRRLLRQARILFHEQKAYSDESAVLRKLASAHLEQGQRDAAFKLTEEMIQLAREAGDPRIEAGAHILRATYYNRSGKVEDAFASGYKAREIFKRMGDPSGVARSSYALGMQYLELYETQKALVYLTEALTLARATKDERLESIVLERLAVHSNRTGDSGKALEYGLQALELANGSERYVLITVISATYARLGRFQEALHYAFRSQEIGRRLRNANFERTAFVRIGIAQLGLGDDRSAEASFRRVLTNGTDTGSNVSAHLNLGKVFESRNDLRTAAAHYEKSAQLADALLNRRRTNEDRIGSLTAHIEAYTGAVRGPLRLYFAGYGGEHARKAFVANERIRNRIFSEHLALARSQEKRGASGLDARLETVNRRMNEVSRGLLDPSLQAPGAARLHKEFQELEFQETAIKREINGRDRRFETNIQVHDLEVEQVQAALKPGAAFIEFYTGNPAAAFVVTSDRFRVVPLPNLGNAAVRVAGYTGLISRGSAFDRFGAAAGLELYRDLVEPAVAALPAGTAHLILAPDGPLEMLPFDVLVADANGRFLIEKFSLSYMPSANSFSMLNDWRPSGQSRPLLAIADPWYPAPEAASLTRSLFEHDQLRITPLPYTRQEVDSIVNLAGADADVLSGRNASEGAVKQLDLSKYRTLHFATHGIASQNHPDRSALILSLDPKQTEDGFLQVREIYNLKLNADLVVLSACETNQADQAIGEGVGGLARAFFFAGARSLVASLWKVDDRATSELMSRFYGYLNQGLSKADSLRRTKIDMIRKPGMAPRHWAAFILLGEADGRIDFGARRNDAAVAAPASFLAAVLTLVLVLSRSLRGRRGPA